MKSKKSKKIMAELKALNQPRFLQPLRSGNVLGSKKEAEQALQNLIPDLAAKKEKTDGTFAVARYGEGKSLLGVFCGTTEKPAMTIFDGDSETIAALAERLDTLEGGVEVAGSVDKKIDDAVKALDVPSVGVAGQYIESVVEEDGKVTAVAKDLVDAQDKVLSTGATGIKSDVKVVKETENLAANVLEQFKLVGKDGVTALGETIKVYKDKALKKVEIGKADAEVDPQTGVITPGSELAADALLFVYHTEDGTYQLVAIDIADFLRESEFGNGLKVEEGVVSVKVNEGATEKFLKVSEAGVEVTGVTAAIEAKVNAAKVTVEPKEDGYVRVAVVPTDGGGAVVTVSENDIASAKGLAQEITDRQGEITRVEGLVTTEKDRAENAEKGLKDALDAEIAARKAVDGQTGQTYSKNTAFSEEVPNGVHYIGEANSLNEADVKLDAALKVEADRAVAAEGVLTNSVTAEAEARKAVTGVDADTYAANQSTTYLKAATSLKDADEKLDVQVKANADAIDELKANTLKGLKAGNGIDIAGDTASEKTISVKLDTVKLGNVLENSENGLFLSDVWDCGTF